MNWKAPSAVERGLAAVSRPLELRAHQVIEKLLERYIRCTIYRPRTQRQVVGSKGSQVGDFGEHEKQQGGSDSRTSVMTQSKPQFLLPGTFAGRAEGAYSTQGARWLTLKSNGAH